MVMEKKTPKPYGKSIDSLQFLMGGYGSKKTPTKTSGKTGGHIFRDINQHFFVDLETTNCVACGN